MDRVHTFTPEQLAKANELAGDLTLADEPTLPTTYKASIKALNEAQRAYWVACDSNVDDETLAPTLQRLWDLKRNHYKLFGTPSCTHGIWY